MTRGPAHRVHPPGLAPGILVNYYHRTNKVINGTTNRIKLCHRLLWQFVEYGLSPPRAVCSVGLSGQRHWSDMRQLHRPRRVSLATNQDNYM